MKESKDVLGQIDGELLVSRVVVKETWKLKITLASKTLRI